MKRACALLIALAVSSGAPELSADEDKRASKLFQRAAAAYARGRMVEAAEAFESAFELSPRGATIYNAGLAWLEAGERLRAARAFERALAAGDLVDPQLSDAKHRLSVLERVLGRVRVEATHGRVSLGDVKNAQPPVTVWVEPGPQSVELKDGEKTQRKSVNVGAGELQTLRFSDEPRADTPKADHPSRPERASDGSRRPWAFVALGVSAAAVGAAIVIGSEGIEARDRFEKSERTDADAHDRALSLRLWANVAWGVAIVGAGTGAYLLLSPEPASNGALLPRGITLSGKF